MAQEAAADGLLDAEDLRATVLELRSEYASTLHALGLEAAQLPDPALDTPPPRRVASSYQARGRKQCSTLAAWLLMRALFAAAGS